MARASCYKVYVTNLNEVKSKIDECKITDLGFCFEVCSREKIETYSTSSLIGKSEVFLCEENDINRIFDLNGLSFLNRYKIDDILVFEGRNNCGAKTQAAFSNGKLTIGTPAIIGSY